MSALRLLALDAATSAVHVGLQAPECCRTLELPAGAAASAGLLPALQGLMRDAGLAWAQLDAIAFGRGPGAFTGLRTAAAVAQGLALGTGRPVIAIDTLLAVAEDARLALEAGAAHEAATATATATATAPAATDPAAPLFWAMTDARMGEAYAACWRLTAGGWQPEQAPALWPPDALAAELAAQAAAGACLVAAGNALAAHAQAFAALPASVRRLPDAQPRGAALLRLAAIDWAAGRALDPALALPLYVRDKVAETTAERALRSSGAAGAAGAPAASDAPGTAGAAAAAQASSAAPPAAA
ncbi:MAG: tRNA (adenosine(37)-N6)-threonylcarbamoyltransferase complex dimerization subunit type 1 TsaB [Burkholderiales bacterium]|nr:tRNA (adenosine(37)-N6)-threonylcarbamoyltransferase complex dimerization subunit type 1 TsaB [Burkholderiales bacterium]